MKKIYFLLLFLFISVSSAFSQNNPTTKNTYLPTSSTESQFALIYKLKDSKKIFKNKDIVEVLDKNKTDLTSFMTLVDSVETDKLNSFGFSDSMGYGHYLTVWTEEEILKVKLTTIAPLNVVLQSDAKRAWLIIYDSLGNELPNLKVKLNHQNLSYNKKVKSYTLPNHRKEVTIKIEYAGQTWHLVAKKQKKYRRRGSFIKKAVYSFPIKYFWIVPYREVRRVVRAIDYGNVENLGVIRFFVDLFTKEDESYTKHAYFDGQHREGSGYIVMDKLKYRPLDTLRFKTYLVDKKGIPIEDDEIDVFFSNDRYIYKKNHSVKSYRKGGFESEIVLVDSLETQLGGYIGIVLKNKKGKILISEDVMYEDYILPEIKSFKVETTDKNQYRNTPFALRIKAKDFNNLTILDGKINIEIESVDIQATYEPSINIKKVIWEHEQKLEPFGETLIYIPDSIFPNADLLYNVKAILLNSNNERLEKKLSINYNYFIKKPTLEARFEDGFVYATYREGTDTVSKKGFIYRYFTDNFKNQTLKGDSVEFPFKEKVNAIYNHFDFQVNTDEYEKNSFLTKRVNVPNSLYIEGYFLHDSLIMIIENPFKSLVRYSLFCKNNLIEKKADSSSLIRIAIKDRYKKVYILQTSHTFGGNTYEDQEAFLRNRKQLFVSLDAPLLTSPSFKEKINVTVTDYKKRPVQDADLTVVATNGKFDDYTRVNISNSQESRFRFKTKKRLSEIELKKQTIQHDYLSLYPYWQNRFGLDSIAYYNFIFPKKEGFRVSIPYQNIYDSLQTKLKNINAGWDQTNYLKEEFKRNHDLNIGALFPFFFTQKGYEDIAWIKIDDSLTYLSTINFHQDHLIVLSEGVHKLEIRLKHNIISIDSISIPMGKETILSFDLDNLPSYVHTKKVSSKLSNEEKIMLGSHTFVGVTYGYHGWNPIMQIQQGKGDVTQVYSTSSYDEKTNIYRHKWRYPLLHKGEFRILRETEIKWDTLYFEPFVSYDMEEGKYVKKDSIITLTLSDGRDTTLTSTYEFEKGKISSNKTFPKKTFFPTYKSVQLTKTAKTIAINHALPFFDYSYFAQKRYKETLYEWNTSQFQVISKEWNKLIFKNSDSLSENFEKEYFFENLIPFKGKIIAGTYQVSVYYKYHYEECARINDIKVEEYNADSLPLQINFEEAGMDCYGKKKVKVAYNSNDVLELEKLENHPTNYYKNDNFTRNVRTYMGKVTNEIGEPLPGATVIVKGTNRGTITDIEGNYSITTPVGSILVFQYVGYSSIEKVTTNYNIWLDVSMNESSELLESVVVSSYSPSRQNRAMVTSISQVSSDYLTNSAGGINSSKNLKKSLALSNIVNLETKSLDVEDYFAPNKKKNIRNYFTDNAIWQPTLKTDENGKASFEVTYPDDITSWKTLAIAYGENNQNGQALVQTNSFLTLSGQLSLPRFLIEGDSVRIIGKIASYSRDSIKVNSYFDLEGKKIPQKERKILFSSVDSLRFSVADNSSKTVDLSIDSLTSLQDSLTVQYVMNADISEKQVYTDGEERKIPIFKKGVIQRRGVFAILEGDTTLDLRDFKDSISNQNPIKLQVKDNILEVMVSELEHIQSYAYACNEQKASKIRAYILEKDIKTALNLPFETKKQKELEELIKKLVEAQYDDGWWGWWATSAPNAHMTAYIYGILFDAKEKGYEISNETLSKAENALRLSLFTHEQQEKVEIYTVLAKNKVYQKTYKDSVEKLSISLQIQEDIAEHHSLYNQLSILRLRQLYDLPISLRILEIKQKKNIFGSIFWSETNYRGYYSLFRNKIQLNILAYQILRQAKGKNMHSIDLAKVRQYFLENRNQSGYWTNTYESARILSTILPDFESKGKNSIKTELQANGQNLMETTEQVFSKENLPNEITKKGLAPVFVSLSQEYFVPQVTQKTSDNFHIKTYFKDANSEKITELKSDSVYIKVGKPIVLTIEVTAKQESEYVSIEVPIPASCVYGKNPYSFRHSYYYYHRGIETYREEFKHKTAIFCTRMPTGTHTFEIILEPRYSGVFTLNPASVELMYFPSVKGNEGTKKVFVE